MKTPTIRPLEVQEGFTASTTPSSEKVRAGAAVTSAAPTASATTAASPRAKVSFRAVFASPLTPLFVAIFIDIFAVGLVIPLFPYYLTKVGGNDAQYGMLYSVYGAMQFIGSPLMGRLSDKWGRKNVLMLSCLGAGCSYLLLGFASSVWMLFASRIPVGIVKQTISVANAYVADTTAPSDRAINIGLVSMMASAGFICGPYFGGILSEYDMVLPAIASSILLAIECLVIYFFLEDPPRRTTPATVVMQHDGDESVALGGHESGGDDGGDVEMAPLSTVDVRHRHKTSHHGDGPATSSTDASKHSSSNTDASWSSYLQSMLSPVYSCLSYPHIPNLLLISLVAHIAFLVTENTYSMYIKEEFDVTPRENGFILSCFGFSNLLVQGLVVPFLTTKYSEALLLSVSMGLQFFALMGNGLARDRSMLMMMILPIVTAKGVFRTCLTSSITLFSPTDGVGGVLGLSGLLESVGRVIAPLIGGYLMQGNGPRAPSFFSAAVSIVLFVYVTAFPVASAASCGSHMQGGDGAHGYDIKAKIV